MSILSILLVAAQAVWLILLACTGEFIASGHAVIFAAQCLAILFGLSAIVSVGFRQLRVRPEVHPEARLIMTGPYRFIRHPMYTSVLAFCTCAIVADYSILRLALLVALAATMIGKLLYEERLLDRHFAGYADYRQRTWRIIPWIF